MMTGFGALVNNGVAPTPTVTATCTASPSESVTTMAAAPFETPVIEKEVPLASSAAVATPALLLATM